MAIPSPTKALIIIGIIALPVPGSIYAYASELKKGVNAIMEIILNIFDSFFLTHQKFSMRNICWIIRFYLFSF